MKQMSDTRKKSKLQTKKKLTGGGRKAKIPDRDWPLGYWSREQGTSTSPGVPSESKH